MGNMGKSHTHRHTNQDLTARSAHQLAQRTDTWRKFAKAKLLAYALS